jgi:hypothetical protein
MKEGGQTIESLGECGLPAQESLFQRPALTYHELPMAPAAAQRWALSGTRPVGVEPTTSRSGGERSIL